jgi:hypothetical protein
MTLAAALVEAYAVADNSGDILDTLELDHPTFPAPLRFVNGVPIKDLYETVNLPVVPGGPAVPFTVVPFSFTRPSFDEGGASKAKLRVDNVSRALQEPLDEAVASDQPLTVIYRNYSTNDDDNPEVISGLRMSNVALSALSAEGELSYEEIEMKAFPGETYSFDQYPGIYGQ